MESAEEIPLSKLSPFKIEKNIIKKLKTKNSFKKDLKMEHYLAQRLECSPMARETWVQSQVESYQRL